MTVWRLRTRLTVWFAGSIMAILVPFLAGILALEWRSMRAALDHHLSEDLEVAAQMLVRFDSVVGWRSTMDTDPGYDAGPQRWVEVYNSGGEPLFLRGVPRSAAIRAAIAPPPPGSQGFRTLKTPAGAHVRTLTVERDFGDHRLWVRVARSEDGLRQDLSDLILLFSIGAPLGVLAAAFAGHLIAGRALAPLGRMAERARSISAEHLAERLPVENAEDELGRLATVFNDTFARLESSFERLKRFTADASHELRTPLTAIRSVGEVALREAHDEAAYREIIGSMLEEVERLSRVVETLLMLSRWESGGARPALETVDLQAITDDVVGQLAVLAEERDVTIDVRLAGPLVVVCDPVMARQAILNVVDNAIKFTRPRGRVTIWSRTPAEWQELIVDDEGAGIPPDQRERVLQRFYRIGEGRGRAEGGAGLGLAIVHWALTANRGRIAIDGNPAGGARIVLSLPRPDASRAAQNRS